MPFYFFVWTQEIVDHLGEHEITPEEFEEIVSNPEYEDVSRSSGNPWHLVGQRREGAFAASSNDSTTI